MMISILGLQACSMLPGKVSSPNPVVGAWLVKDTDAPFPYHMYVFNSDGTMQQANPDADLHGANEPSAVRWARGRCQGDSVEKQPELSRIERD